MSLDPDIEELFKLKGEAFERKREAILKKEVDKIREQDGDVSAGRALAQQWALKKRLDKVKNPLVRFELMQQMFWEQVEKFRKSLK